MKGMSAEARAVQIVKLGVDESGWLKDLIVTAITEAEAAARAEERVTSEKDLAALKCCPKCRFEIEAMHSRDLRAGTFAGEVVKRVEASQEMVRVKARNEALTECANDDASYAAGCNNDVMADAWRSSAHRHLNKIKLPETQSVEPTEKELRDKAMDDKIIPDDRPHEGPIVFDSRERSEGEQHGQT